MYGIASVPRSDRITGIPRARRCNHDILSEQRSPIASPAYLFKVIELLGIRPDLRSCRGIRQRRLAWIGLLPPALRFRIRGHFFHVAVEVVPAVFQIRDKVPVAVNLALVD